MIERLLIMGATGDLTARYLLPAIAALRQAGELRDGFQVVAAGRDDWSDHVFKQWAFEQLAHHAGAVPTPVRDLVVGSTSYHQVDVANAEDLKPIVNGGPIAAYLALPPFLFPAAISALHQAGLADGSIIVIEKPFGQNLREAIELNRQLASVATEDGIFRVDHFLAMSTVQNILSTRLANRILEPLWNSAHIAEIEIVWDESLGLEGRAGYYDGVGALKDMLQNHLLQLLCLIAMEPPLSLNERDLRDRKVDVLRSLTPPIEKNLPQRTRRGQYVAGRIRERILPAYIDEPGVEPGRNTETFAEVEFAIENWRWSGTNFRLRTGKALGQDRKEVTVHFRPVPHGGIFDEDAAPNVLRFGLEPEDVRMELAGIGSHARGLLPVTLAAQLEPAALPPYGQLVHNVLHRNTALSIRGDEAEESWRVVEPVIDAWSRDVVPLVSYVAGSPGPEA